MRTRVRFLENDSSLLTLLELQAPDSHPLLRNAEAELQHLGVRIVRRDKRPVPGGFALRLRVAERDGTPLTPSRRLEVQTVLLSNASPSENPPTSGVALTHSSTLRNGHEPSDARSEETIDRDSWVG